MSTKINFLKEVCQLQPGKDSLSCIVNLNLRLWRFNFAGKYDWMVYRADVSKFVQDNQEKTLYWDD